MEVETIKRILTLRGCTIGEEHDQTDEHEHYLTFTTANKRPGKVVFSSQEQEGKAYVVGIFSELYIKPQHLILVYRNITPFILKIYKEWFKDYFKAELLSVDFLQQYIFDNPLVPEYRVLGVKEKKEVVKAYGGKVDEHMWMTEDDKVALTLNLKKGQLVEVKSYYDHSLKRINKERPPIVWYRYIV